MIECENCQFNEVVIINDYAKCERCGHYTKIKYIEYGGEKMEEVSKKKEINESELFDDKNVPVTGGFMKFKVINDRVFGILKEPATLEKSKDEDFDDQMVYVLENARGVSDGKPIEIESGIIKVGININKKLAVEKANKAQPGQQLGFKYTMDFETEKSKKGKANPFKVIEVYVK